MCSGYPKEQPYLPKFFLCVCPTECDCQNPEPISGVAGISNACPIHNDCPEPIPECWADEHYPNA